MSSHHQLAFSGVEMALLEPAAEPGAEYGEVFTRRWIVEMMLDLVGYTADKDLGAQRIVEPSCGTGAFLVPIVERLITSAELHGRSLSDLGAAIRAFDLLHANAERSQKAAAALLAEAGLPADAADIVASEWVTTADFLLHPHEGGAADFVIGNPPYIRLESVDRRTMDAYRRSCVTMRGRADIYVGFFERGLELLGPGGVLSFICADRWMRNQYGAQLRELVTSDYAVDAVISMHDVDAFEDAVSAYPAVVLLRQGSQRGAAVVETDAAFGERQAARVASWVRRGRKPSIAERGFEATRTEGWFEGRDLWPAASPSNLALIADLEARFPPLQDPATGTRVGIGVATGCDDVFITSDAGLVEPEQLLPLLQAPDTANGSVNWSGRYLVNPWNGSGLVDLDRYPRLAEYLRAHRGRLRQRHIAQRRPATWYRTIDRVDHDLTGRPKLVIPDMKAAANPVLDEGSFYPHHNLYFVVSDSWDLEVLGGLLLSDVANLFVGAYCVKMRGGCYRFQAQYLRRIRVPPIDAVSPATRRALAKSFRERDCDAATHAAHRAYGIERVPGSG